MIQVKIYMIGKESSTFSFNYEKRMTAIAKITTHFAKDDEQLVKWLEKEEHFFVLDVAGDALTSENFAKKIANASRLTFVIGGAEGLPECLKKHPHRISFSKMTFPHQIVRLLLIEQIYRAFEIFKGSPYHK